MASARKWTYGFLALAGAAALAVVILAAFFMHFRGILDKGSKAFTDDSILAISRNWDKDAFLERTSEEFRAHLNDIALAEMAASMSRMGKLVKYDGSRGEANIALIAAVGNGKPAKITAEYAATAEYENGNLKFLIDLIFVDGLWKIQSLSINRA